MKTSTKDTLADPSPRRNTTDSFDRWHYRGTVSVQMSQMAAVMSKVVSCTVARTCFGPPRVRRIVGQEYLACVLFVFGYLMVVDVACWKVGAIGLSVSSVEAPHVFARAMQSSILLSAPSPLASSSASCLGSH